MSRINRQVCRNCGATNSLQIDRTTAAGDITCTECGTVQEENPIVSEVQFGESSSGAAMVQGSMVGSDQARATFGGRQNAMESREQTLANGRRKIHRLAVVLKIQPHVADAAGGWFKLALTQNFVQGRRSQNVLAACLYVACRKEKTPHMLIDFSSRLQISVYSLGATFLKMVKALQITNLPLADPSLFIQHFASSLNLGNKTKKVTKDACKIAHRMTNDWIHEGRRPAGIAGACVMLAARMNNIRRTYAEIVNVAHVAPETLQRRLNEFKKTASGGLSVKEFRQSTSAAPSMPPSYDRNRKLELKLQKQIEERESALRRYIDLANRRQLVPIEVPAILLTPEEIIQREVEKKEKRKKEMEQGHTEDEENANKESAENINTEENKNILPSEEQTKDADVDNTSPAVSKDKQTSNDEEPGSDVSQPLEGATADLQEPNTPAIQTKDSTDEPSTQITKKDHGSNGADAVGELGSTKESKKNGTNLPDSIEENQEDSNADEESAHEESSNHGVEADQKNADGDAIENLSMSEPVSNVAASAQPESDSETHPEDQDEPNSKDVSDVRMEESTDIGPAEKEIEMEIEDENSQQEHNLVPHTSSTSSDKEGEPKNVADSDDEEIETKESKETELGSENDEEVENEVESDHEEVELEAKKDQREPDEDGEDVETKMVPEIEHETQSDVILRSENEPIPEEIDSHKTKIHKEDFDHQENNMGTSAKSEPARDFIENRESDDSDSDDFQDALEDNENTQSDSYSATHHVNEATSQFEIEVKSGLQEEVEKELKRELARQFIDESDESVNEEVILVKESEQGRRLRPRQPVTTSVPIPAPPRSPSVEREELTLSDSADDYLASEIDDHDSDADELNAFLREDERRGFNKKPVEQHLFVNEDSDDESAEENTAASSPRLFVPEDDEPFEQPPQLRARLARLDDRSRRRDLRQSKLKETRMSEFSMGSPSDNTTAKQADNPETPRKRGRPRKDSGSKSAPDPEIRGRGRPRKDVEVDDSIEVPTRRRGRPYKTAKQDETIGVSRGRGRPRKVAEEDDIIEIPRGRGRPRKVASTSPKIKPEPGVSDSDHEIWDDDYEQHIKAETSETENEESTVESDYEDVLNDRNSKKKGKKGGNDSNSIAEEGNNSGKKKTKKAQKKSDTPRRPYNIIPKPINKDLEEERAMYRREMKAQQQNEMIQKIQASIEKRREMLKRMRERALKPSQSQKSAQVRADKDDALLQSVLISSEISESELTKELERIINKQKKGLEGLRYVAPSEKAEAIDFKEKIDLDRPRNLVKNLPSSKDLLQKVRSDADLDSEDDDDEVNDIELTGEALEQKTRIWTGLNYDYIMDQERKRLKEEADILSGNTSGNSKKKRRISKSEIPTGEGTDGLGLAESMESIGVNPITGESSSAAESTKRMLAKKPFSKKINYDTLNDLFSN